MKKWLIFLCCLLVAGIVAFAFFMQNNNTRIDGLNKDLWQVQSEYNNLKEKNEIDEKTIQDLNRQVEDLTAEKGQLTAEKDQLAAEKDHLNETLDGLNRNLSSSQQKLQGVMYILTEGAQGSIDSLLSPYIKIFEDVPLNDPYFEAVSFVYDRQLMTSLGEEVFGVSESATLGEFAESLYQLQGKNGSGAGAVSDLLQAEQAWLAAQEVTAAEEAAEPETEETVSAPAAEEAAYTEETTDEEAAPAEETAAEGTEESETAEETESSAEEQAADMAGAAETAEMTEESAEEPVEDETTILTRERLRSLCSAFCSATGKEIPEITFPESESDNAVRGDLAVVLLLLGR